MKDPKAPPAHGAACQCVRCRHGRFNPGAPSTSKKKQSQIKQQGRGR